MLAFSCSQQSTTENVNLEGLFVHEIVPIFESKCMSCHGNDLDKIEGGLNLSDYQNLLTGGNSDKPSIVPGKPGKSLIVHAINRKSEQYAMPPKEGDKLSEMDIEIIYKWIDGGAPWPNEQKRAEILLDTTWSYGNRLTVKTSGGQSTIWDNRKYQNENLWAYYPLKSQEIPWQSLVDEKGNPIDAFLQQKRNDNQFVPAFATSKRLLLRRATFDLTGLPPTPEELDNFLTDTSSDSFEKVINRLLSSPHYGEQWGRHWLDVVRYADSDGFSNDYIRPNAWRYRDYVIRSFNQDKPYNQFVMEQLAGDELNPDDPEMLIATGFLRMGPWEHTGMSVAAETRHFYLDDVTNIVGETFLATPLNCAKCHDHKYDPIPTKDYYGIQAVFATTQFTARTSGFLPSENVNISKSEKDRIIGWLEKTEEERKELSDKEEAGAKAWYREKCMAYVPKNERRKLPEEQQPPRYLGLSFEDLGYRKVLQKRAQLLMRQQERFEPLVYTVYDGPVRVVNSDRSLRLPDNLDGTIPETFVLGGGSVYAPLDPVAPGILSVVLGLHSKGNENKMDFPNAEIPATMHNRRLAFAKWVTDSDNPIFARSIVNRVWQHHFGRGISATPNNFGATGGKPTHPELLDWLATYFMENNWSVKKLDKLIMTSQAYQMSSEHPEMDKISQIDPDNGWLCYFTPRRLEAEELKDAMLSLSGELNPEIGGFPVRPEINQEVAMQPRHTMGSIAPAYQPSRTPEERNRRSIYSEKYRTLIDPDLEVFNQPGADFSCERRNESTVTPQAFTLFNGNNTRARSLAMAQDIIGEEDSAEKRINLATKRIWFREPSEEEVNKSIEYLDEMTRYHTENQPPIIAYPTSVKREMFEEMTGESFEYVEELDIYKDYVPDMQPSEVDEQTRAFADLIAVLFNSNEFVYVY
ncbi:MAG: PSD1 and planctomycete cytochrome C domain-containing protein [Bacteroidetes bacterium]|nr:PSD1 and planctomycete cytochrome C domain-containing protein [Bacteroidota bacterium]MDA1121960.1 PSD1 and planctomycete cytochrome C domain-containing protein [Bacteroidota bacterium]